MSAAFLVLAVFLACVVEAVEALTIVLAVGTVRGWRSVTQGIWVALAALAVFVAALGPALSAIPIDALRLAVGALLLVFGLQWLRKAILRASGFKALHDEDAIFAREAAAAEVSERTRRGRVDDWYAFTLAFKGVLLEGLEVAFIVVTFGSTQHNVPLAVIGAAAAIAVVTLAGFAIRAPLARVPENTMKFVVGLLLTTFGTFWAVEGAGAHWPGSDAALLAVLAFYAALALALTSWLRQVRTQRVVTDPPGPAREPVEVS